MTTHIIYLARHGETDWNRELRWQGGTDIALNDSGRAQAAELAERLRPFAPVGVHASDLARARETGEIVAARLGVPFLGADARLRERSFGVFEGLTQMECEARHPEAWQRYLADRRLLPEGAEPADAVTRRMLAAVHAVAASSPASPVVVIGHGSAIRALVAAVTGASCPPIANGAVFRLAVDAGHRDPERAIGAADHIDLGHRRS
jgi:broad specificity phosphatase PhoE